MSEGASYTVVQHNLFKEVSSVNSGPLARLAFEMVEYAWDRVIKNQSTTIVESEMVDDKMV
jgi:hypothetical protein